MVLLKENIGGYIEEIDRRSEVKIDGLKLLEEKLKKMVIITQNQARLVEGLQQENMKVGNSYFRLMQRACARLGVLLEGLRENFDVTVDSKVEQVIEVYAPERKASTQASKQKVGGQFQLLRRRQAAKRRQGQQRNVGGPGGTKGVSHSTASKGLLAPEKLERGRRS